MLWSICYLNTEYDKALLQGNPELTTVSDREDPHLPHTPKNRRKPTVIPEIVPCLCFALPIGKTLFIMLN